MSSDLNADDAIRYAKATKKLTKTLYRHVLLTFEIIGNFEKSITLVKNNQ